MKSVYTLCFLFVTTFLVNNLSRARQIDSAFIKTNLAASKYAIDSDAGAVILYEKVSTVVTNDHYTFLKKETVHRVIKVLKNDAVSIGNIHVLYPKNDYRNYVSRVRATTYNLSGNNVVAATISDADLYRKHISGNKFELSFSLPSVKVGSVIDYYYEVNTEFNEVLLTWQIQEEYPKLIGEYNLEYEGGFEFTAISHVHEKQKDYPTAEDAEAGPDNFCFVKGGNNMYAKSLWIRKNVRSIEEEPYVNNIRRNMERMEFQVTGYATPMGPEHFANSWDKLNDLFWNKLYWGKLLKTPNRFLNNIVDSLVASDSTDMQKSKAIFSYVRSHFKCRKDENVDPRNLVLKDIFHDGEGNELEINFLLTGMLTHAGIDASPALLSTTSNFPASSVFPIADHINYAVCAVKIDSGYVFLDASDKNNAFGYLPAKCYNGFTWILGRKGTGIDLTPDVVTDKTVYGVKIYNFTDSSAKAEITTKYGTIKSSILRRQWENDEEEQKNYITKQESGLPLNFKVISSTVNNLTDPDTNLVIKYTCTIPFDKNQQGILLNTSLIKFFTENPFKATERKSPVEFPFKSEEKYVMNVMLPEYLEPDSLPRPVLVNFEDGSMVFRKAMARYEGMNTLTINSSFNINSTYYETSYYDALRQFFQSMMAAEDRVITLKRKSQ